MKKYVKNIFNEYNDISCYWAGLLAADGCIDTNGTIRLELEGKDKNTVENFKEDCCSEHAIGYREETNAYSIRFNDHEIIEALKFNFNVTTDKTFKLQFPILPIDMYPHYLRGFFDGDGCFTEFFNQRPTASYRVFLTSGSLEFLEDLLDYLRKQTIIKGGSIVKKSANCWHMQLAISDTNGFLNYIYLNNCVSSHRFMTRKYNKYKQIIIDGIRQKKIKV